MITGLYTSSPAPCPLALINHRSGKHAGIICTSIITDRREGPLELLTFWTAGSRGAIFLLWRSDRSPGLRGPPSLSLVAMSPTQSGVDALTPSPPRCRPNRRKICQSKYNANRALMFLWIYECKMRHVSYLLCHALQWFIGEQFKAVVTVDGREEVDKQRLSWDWAWNTLGVFRKTANSPKRLYFQ